MTGSRHLDLSVANNDRSKQELTPRQLRRQQQREAAKNKESQQTRPASASTAPLTYTTLPVPTTMGGPPSELLGPSVLVPALCTVIVLATMLFHVAGLTTLKGNELTWPQPLFTAVNAATLTGFQQVRNPNDYTPFGQALVYLLTLFGMMFSFIAGGVAVIRIARLRFSDFYLIAWALGSVVAVSVIGGIAMMGSDRTFSQDVFQAVSAFGNSGLTLGHLPDSNSARVFLVLLPLGVLGGLGLPVLMELADLIFRREPLSQHSRSVLGWTAGVYIALVILLMLLRWPGNLIGLPQTAAESSQLALNSRSTGFSFQAIAMLPQATTFLLVLAMSIGAGPAGSGGGIKVTTLSVLTTGTRDCLAGRTPGRRFGAALLWLGIYAGLLAVSTIALLITDPEIHLERTLFLAASALSNAGLSHNPIDSSVGMGGAGSYVLCATMLVGRVAPVLMLWYLIDTTPDATIAIG